MNSPSQNNLWLFLEVLAKRRRLILSLVIIATIISVVVSLILPKWYQANALLLPPKNMNLQVGEMARLSEAVSITSGLDLPVLVTPSDIYVQILRSRRITSRIIDQYDLKTRYKTDNFDETYEALMANTNFSVTNEGMLSIEVEDKDPQTAADIANSFVDELDNVNQEIVNARIKQTFDFVKARLEQVKNELDSSRMELEAFQMEHKTVDFDEQTRLAVEQAINLKVNLSEIEFKLRLKEMNLGKENTELQELERQRKIILNQLSELEKSNADSSFFSLPVADIPTLKGKYETLYSNVKVSEDLYAVLLNQREQIKMKELEKMPTISVLDRASVPQLRSRPKRSYIVLATFALSLIFALFWAMLLEYLVRLEKNQPEDHRRAMTFIGAYLGWLPGIKKQR